MASPPTSNSYIIHNCLLFAYKSLRSSDRFVQDSLQSPYEKFYSDLSKRYLGKSPETAVPISEVEAFYTKRLAEKDFMANVHSRVLHAFAAGTPTGTVSSPSIQAQFSTAGGASSSMNSFNHFSVLYSLVWEMLSKQNSSVCSKLPLISGRQLWEVFLKLDRESKLKLHVDDLVDVILRIFKTNGHEESPDNIVEWFCGEETVDFWSFFHQLTEKYIGLLQVQVIQELHQDIVLEILREGKLEKKGHVVHNWKMRWFVLTPSALTYFESRDKMLLKGSMVVNSSSRVQNVSEFKARRYRFKIVCEDSKTVMDISAPDSQAMEDWMGSIRTAIMMHRLSGRNFLHKHRLALNSANAIRPPQSLQLNRLSSLPGPQCNNTLYSPVSPGFSSTYAVLTSEGSQGDLACYVSGRECINDSDSAEDAPPLPSRRIDSSIDDPRYVNNEVFDKFMRERNCEEQRIHITRRRCSSVEALPIDIKHVVVEGDVYAVIKKKSPKVAKRKGKNLVASPKISPNVNAQLSPESTRQIKSWIQEGNMSPTTSPISPNKFPPRDIKSKSGSPSSISKLPVSPVSHRRAQNGEAKERKKLRSPTSDAGYAKFDFQKTTRQVEIDDQGFGRVVYEHENRDSVEKKRQTHSTPMMYTREISKKIQSSPQFSNMDATSANYPKDPNKKEPPYVNVRREVQAMCPQALPRYRETPTSPFD